MGGWDKFNHLANWMMKLAYINVLWILFSLIGLFLFGFFPATIAMFTIVRKWLRGENQFRVFQTFWQVFCHDFVKVNGFALFFFLIGYFLYYDLMFIQLNSGKLPFLFPVVVFILISYFLTLLFFFPVYVHFNLKFFQYIKQSFLIAINAPLEALQMIVAAVILYFITSIIPGIIPLFTGSVLTVASTWICFRAFAKIEKKKGLP